MTEVVTVTLKLTVDSSLLGVYGLAGVAEIARRAVTSEAPALVPEASVVEVTRGEPDRRGVIIGDNAVQHNTF